MALCLKFAMKTIRNPKFNGWFEKSEIPVIRTRNHVKLLKTVPTPTVRFLKSSVPTMTNLLTILTSNL